MKSGTPKTYTFIPITGQLNNSVRLLLERWLVCYLPPSQRQNSKIYITFLNINPNKTELPR